MTARTLWSAALGALALISLAFVGCDERNDADAPQTVYHLGKTISTQGVALGVDLRGTLLGVAAASSGTYVYDITDVGTPDEVFHFTPSGELYSRFVNIDPVNNLVMTYSEPNLAPGDKYPIHKLDNGERIGTASFTGGAVDLQVTSSEGHFIIWKAERSTRGAEYSEYCYNADSAEWRPDYCTEFYVGFSAAFGLPQGFGIKDSLIALALSNYEIRIHNFITGLTLSTLPTSGDPYDCAWSGNLILVADNLLLTVVDASDVEDPEILSTLNIPGADRLQRVVVDGNYAILLDDSDGAYVVDISDPANPQVVQSISFPEISGISADNGVLAISDEQLGVLIYTR